MNNLFFKGLEKAMNEGYYICVFNNFEGYTKTLVKSINKERNLTCFESGNIISSMSNASKTIIDETSKIDKKDLQCYKIILDKMVERDYVLHFIKLLDDTYLATASVWEGKKEGYTPVIAAISSNLEESLKQLNKVAINYNSNLNTIESLEEIQKEVFKINQSSTIKVRPYVKKLVNYRVNKSFH